MQALENQIGSSLAAVRDKVREAAGALGRTRPDAMTEALNKARDLARGMESMDQRMQVRDEARKKGVWPPPGGGDRLISQQNKIVLPSAFSPLQ